MKKHHLFVAICCMATSLFAQKAPALELHERLSQNPAQLTPDIVRSEINQFYDQAKLDPPALEMAYNLTDSIYEYSWDNFFNNWTPVRKTLIENDCTIGKPIVELEQVDDFGTGGFANYRRRLSQYFEDGNFQTVETFRWHTTLQTWEKSDFTSYVRPNAQAESWSKNWNEFENSFDGGSRTVYFYDTDNKLIGTEAYDWVVDTWELVFRTTYTYTNGLNTEQLSESYDATTNTWTPRNKTTRTYDANGNILTQTTESDLGNGFVVQQLTNYTYNAAGQLTEQVSLNNSGNGLENAFRTTYDYYASGNNKSLVGFIWLPTQQEWLMNFTIESREDGQASVIWFKLFFDDFTGQFDFGLQNLYFYTAEGLPDYQLTNELNPQGPEEWVPYEKITYTYDGNNRPLEEILQNWDDAQAEYVNDYRYYRFNTGCLFSDADEAQPQDIANCLHANPLRPGQTIQCSPLLPTDTPLTLSLYTLMGQRIHQQAFMPGDAFQPSQPLANGLYLLDIRTEKGNSLHQAKVVVME